MENITLGEIEGILKFILAFGGSVSAVIVGVKKVVEKIVSPIGLDNAKNYIVPFLARLERGEAVSDIEVERFHEEYKYYIDHGGNSYIKDKVEKLREAKKL